MMRGTSYDEKKRKVFVAWLNKRLEDCKSLRRVVDLPRDLGDGEVLLLVTSHVLKVKTPSFRPPSRDGNLRETFCLDRLQCLCDLLLTPLHDQTLPPGVKPRSFYDCNERVTLGFVWWLIKEWSRRHLGKEVQSEAVWIDEYETKTEHVTMESLSQYVGDGRFQFALHITALECALRQRQPIDLMLCIDISGSMDKHKIGVVREVIKSELLPKLSSSDRVGIICFSESAFVTHHFDWATNEMLRQITSKLESVSCNGGTDCLSALRLVLEEYERVGCATSMSAQCLLFFTDGQDYIQHIEKMMWPDNLPTSGAEVGHQYSDFLRHNQQADAIRMQRLEQLKALCGAWPSRLSSHWMGCGNDMDAEFLGVAAEATHGRLVSCTEGSLASTLSHYFAETTSIFVSSVSISLKSENTATVLHLFSGSCFVQGQGGVCSPSHNLGLDGLDFFAYIDIPSNAQSDRVHVSCTYSKSNCWHETVKTFSFSKQIPTHLIPDLDQEFERISLERVVREARSKPSAASSLLKSFLSVQTKKKSLLSHLLRRVQNALSDIEHSKGSEAETVIIQLLDDISVNRKIILDDSIVDLRFDFSSVGAAVQKRVQGSLQLKNQPPGRMQNSMTSSMQIRKVVPSKFNAAVKSRPLPPAPMPKVRPLPTAPDSKKTQDVKGKAPKSSDFSLGPKSKEQATFASPQVKNSSSMIKKRALPPPPGHVANTVKVSAMRSKFEGGSASTLPRKIANAASSNVEERIRQFSRKPEVLSVPVQVRTQLVSQSRRGSCSICLSEETSVFHLSARCHESTCASLCSFCIAKVVSQQILQRQDICKGCNNPFAYMRIKSAFAELQSMGEITPERSDQLLNEMVKLRNLQNEKDQSHSFSCRVCESAQHIGGGAVFCCRKCNTKYCAQHKCFLVSSVGIYTLYINSAETIKVKAFCSTDVDRCIKWVESCKMKLQDEHEREKRWEELLATERLMEEEGYRRCPHCFAAFRRVSGCNHMVCGRAHESDQFQGRGCGKEFTYPGLPFVMSSLEHPLYQSMMQQRPKSPCQYCSSHVNSQMFFTENQKAACDACVLQGRTKLLHHFLVSSCCCECLDSKKKK